MEREYGIFRLNALIQFVKPYLLDLSDKEASLKPAPDKWSAKEILGHLIDSACNNHRRFVQAHLGESLIFDGYDQDGWVSVQSYQDVMIADLVALWYYYNLHMAHLIGKMDRSVLVRSTKSHNFDEITFHPVARDTPANLEYLVNDYIDHLEHHLRQILPDLNLSEFIK